MSSATDRENNSCPVEGPMRIILFVKFSRSKSATEPMALREVPQSVRHIINVDLGISMHFTPTITSTGHEDSVQSVKLLIYYALCQIFMGWPIVYAIS